MEEIEQLHIEIEIKFSAFVSARNIAKIVFLMEQAVFEVELDELEYLMIHFKEIPKAIYDEAHEKLYRKSGNTILVKEAQSGSIVLVGIVAGLAVWLLKKTLGETIKEAWLESDLHSRLKNYLLTRLDRKKEALVESIQGKLTEHNIETSIKVTYGTLIVIVLAKEDQELSNELQMRTQYLES